MKRWLQLFISCLYAPLLTAGRTITRTLRRDLDSSCVVICYHTVKAADRVQFVRQLEHLIRWRRVIAADAMFDTQQLHGIRNVAITFDDAFRGVFEHAIPELEKKGIPATIFVPTGFIGKPPGWAVKTSSQDPMETVPTADEMRKISKELFSFGSHTVSHPRLTNISTDQADYELKESKRTLEKLFGRKIELLSFPHGAVNEWLVQRAQSIGYRRAFTIDPRIASFSDRDFVCGRVVAEPGESLIELHLKIIGAYSWLPAVSRFKRWMSFALHTLGNTAATKMGRSIQPKRARQSS